MMCNEWCNLCFCFRDIRRIVVAVGIFQLVTSLLQIVITIAVFTNANQNGTLAWANADYADRASSTTYNLYIALAVFDFFMIIFAIAMLYGNERAHPFFARCYFYPWLILLPFYVMYESAINIYYFYNQFNNIYKAPLSGGASMGYLIPPFIYWIIKEVILYISFVYMLMRLMGMSSHPTFESEVVHGDSCFDNKAGPIMQGPIMHGPMPQMALPRPPPSFTSAPACNVYPPTTACSGGSCATKVNVVHGQGQPMYGYSGGGGR